MSAPPERRAIAAALCLLSLSVSPGCSRPAPAPHGIVLIVLDTLRADGLSAYGNPRPTSPHIDRLAQQGVLFEQAVSHASSTLPGFVGLLSGSYPTARVYDRGLLLHSLVEALAGAGYTTAAFTEGGFVSRYFGVDRGFATFEAKEGKVHLQGADVDARADEAGGVEKTFDAAMTWLRAHASERFFLLVHTYEIHMPYLQRAYAEKLPRGSLPETYRVDTAEAVTSGSIPVGATEVAYVRALYDSGVASADRQVGRLLGLLDELGIADRTLVALTADHGEELGERTPRRLGMHGLLLYDTLLRIPLIIRDPLVGSPPRRIASQVRLVDVMPTLLDRAGVALPPEIDGRSLAPLLRGSAQDERLAYSEISDPDSALLRRIAVREGGWKLIVNLPPLSDGDVPSELYRVSDDPLELHDLSSAEPARKDSLFALMRAQRESIDRSGRARLAVDENAPDALRERLRALGYVR
ncbi:MAG TPA: sulfatase [Myxococcota bacterium]|nr:sulfatase [Myxococcota bacterium]